MNAETLFQILAAMPQEKRINTLVLVESAEPSSNYLWKTCSKPYIDARHIVLVPDQMYPSYNLCSSDED